MHSEHSLNSGAQGFGPSLLKLALILLAIATTWFAHQALADYVFEDSYITYRYAQNVANGQGYVFNPGDRVFGATSPLYTGLLAGLAWLGADIPGAAGWVSALGLGCILWLGASLARRWFGNLPALAFAAVIALGATRMYWAWGMETFLLVPCLLAAAWALDRKRDFTAAFFCALAFLTRYDSALFAVVLFGVMAVRRRGIPWGPGLLALVLVVPWLLFTWRYFGSVFPNTLGAKVGDTSFAEYLQRSVKAQWASLWRPVVQDGEPIFRTLPPDRLVGIALAASAALAALLRTRRHPGVFLLGAHSLLLVLGYSFLAPPIVFTWYLMPAAVLVLLLGLGLTGLLPGMHRLENAIAAIGALAVIPLLLFLPRHWQSLAADLEGQLVYQGRIPAYRQMAERIGRLGLQDARVLTNEPGFVTYDTGNPAIDAAGLVTKGIRFHGAGGPRTSLLDLAREHQPELVIGALPTVLPGYVPLLNPHPFRAMWLRQDRYAEVFPKLLGEVRAGSTEESAWSHPFHMRAAETKAEPWLQQGGRLGWPGFGWANVRSAGRPLTGAILLVQQGYTGNESPAFRIDFDYLAVEAAATHARGTLLQLVVEDQVLFEVGGEESPEGGPAQARELRWGLWPVGLWRGCVARIRMVQTGVPGHWIALNSLTSLPGSAAQVWEDFESGDWGDRWVQAPDGGPDDLSEKAKRWGLPLAASGHAALTVDRPGVQHLRSHPFTVGHRYLSFLFFDFGLPQGMHAELFVDGEVVAREVCTGRGRVVPVTWDLERWQGKTAFFHLVDQSEGPAVWNGVDHLVWSDGAAQ
ncbi:MAG: hypothetical protein R3F33_00460 [Planctomycetota bacterium]